MFYYLFQPILCVIGLHNWYRVKGFERQCSYCKKHQQMTHVHPERGPQWEDKNV